MRRLFLDDVRNPIDCVKYMNPSDIYLKEWDVVRTYFDFVEYMNDNGVPDVVSFDHDLADEHYSSDMYDKNNIYNSLYPSFKEKTGYDCAKWLHSYCVENGLPYPTYLVHSMNPVGRDNILSVFQKR